MGIRKRPPGAEFPQRVDQGLCVTESFHVTFGQVDVPLGMILRKVHGLAEGGKTSSEAACKFEELRKTFGSDELQACIEYWKATAEAKTYRMSCLIISMMLLQMIKDWFSS